MDFIFSILRIDDPNLRWVLTSVTMICISAALTGNFAYLRKRALAGDAVAHSILPGICAAFLIAQSKNPVYLLIGAVASGWLSLFVIDFLQRHSKIKADTALSLVLSVFYGGGALMLSHIQNSGMGSQSGLDKFLFGKAAAMVSEDFIVFGGFAVLLIFILLAFYHRFLLLSFDPNYAQTRGFKIKRTELMLQIISVFSIAIGIQAVGVVLMAALLITPAAAARYWTNSLPHMLLISAFFGTIGAFSGTFISYTSSRMPTGPWIVMVISTIALFSMAFGIKKGVFFQFLKKRRNRKKMLGENILKIFFHLLEKEANYSIPFSAKQLDEQRNIGIKEISKGLAGLQRKSFITKDPNGFALTETGWVEARRVVRLHRLWELYLSKIMLLPGDHVHEDAESIEHVINHEIEAELAALLNYPDVDPHNSPIPYQHD